MKKYYEIVWFDGSDDTIESIHEKEGIDGVIGYLEQWETGEEIESAQMPWGEKDRLYIKQTAKNIFYVVSHNAGLGYYGLTRMEVE